MFDITVEAELTVPQIASIGDVTYAFNVEINEITVTATGNPIPSISVTGLPTGISYENGVISGSSNLAGTYEITVTATNSQGDDTETFDITISAELTVPVITAISDISVAYNTAITTIDVSVSGNPTPSVSVSGLPSGITYTGGEIAGMSTVAGTHQITITATNSEGDDTVTFDITIAEQLTAPQITAIGDVTYAYNANITAIDVTVTGNPTPTVTVTNLPTGITYENEQITGMSTVVGVHQITITAMNSQDTVTEIFDITIEAELIAPQITAISDISVAYNTAITATAVTVTGNPTPTVTVTNLPTGLTYTGGEITGTSTDTGTHEITVTATNSQGDDTVTFDITIEAELTVPAITAIGDISFVYNANITAIDVTITGNPTPSVTVSGLPTGLTYDSTNTEITGMSTAVGAHEITIIATNSQGTDIATFNITIAEQLIAPANHRD